uniref:Uncharacterized protein n=1 Tax=Parascaris equorum TaxID=6256 RepID=A0A914R254_PAREQ
MISKRINSTTINAPTPAGAAYFQPDDTNADDTSTSELSEHKEIFCIQRRALKRFEKSMSAIGPSVKQSTVRHSAPLSVVPFA